MRTDAQSDGRMDRQTDRSTDMTKLAVAFRNFAKEEGIKTHMTNRRVGGIFCEYTTLWGAQIVTEVKVIPKHSFIHA